MSAKSRYAIRKTEAENRFKVQKFSADGSELQEEYFVVRQGSRYGEGNTFLVCTCFAGNKQTCRHRTMLQIFEAAKRVDAGWMFVFDSKTWIEPNTEGT